MDAAGNVMPNVTTPAQVGQAGTEDPAATGTDRNAAQGQGARRQLDDRRDVASHRQRINKNPAGKTGFLSVQSAPLSWVDLDHDFFVQQRIRMRTAQKS